MQNESDNSILDSYILNYDELDDLRKHWPKVNLYENPLIGTEEIRQFVYCKRILYFRHIIHAPMKNTYKMEVGMEKHEKLQNISNRAQNITQKYFNIYLTDPDSNLVGLIDYFEFDGNEAYPVEIKTGNIPPNGLDVTHKLQVTAQALLIEANFDFFVKKVKIFYIKHQQSVEYPILVEDKLKVLNIIEEIKKMLETEKIPNPTEHKGKCVDCECKNYCYP